MVKKKKKRSLWSKEDEPEVDEKNEKKKDNIANHHFNQAVANKFIRNPLDPIEIDEIDDEFGEDSIYSVESIPFEILYTVEKALSDSLSIGAILGYPLMNVRIKIIDAKYSIRRSNPMIFQMATVTLIKEILMEADCQLLEPVMELEISTPNPLVQTLLNDIINGRRGKVGEILQEGSRFNKSDEGQRSLIHATIPLEQTIGYATYLRTMTKVYI